MELRLSLIHIWVLMALAPQGTKVAVLSVEGATKALQKPDPGNERVIVLTKTPIVFEQLLDGGVEIKEVCLGGMGIRGDRKPLINNVSASPDEVDSIRRMKNEKGVNVYYQLVPEQKVVDISNPVSYTHLEIIVILNRQYFLFEFIIEQ